MQPFSGHHDCSTGIMISIKYGPKDGAEQNVGMSSSLLQADSRRKGFLKLGGPFSGLCKQVTSREV